MFRHRKKRKGFLIGAFFGSVVGGISALLLAPKSGKKLRKDISRKYHDVSDKTHDMASSVGDCCSDLCDKAKDIAEDAKDAAKSLVKEVSKRKKKRK